MNVPKTCLLTQSLAQNRKSGLGEYILTRNLNASFGSAFPFQSCKRDVEMNWDGIGVHASRTCLVTQSIVSIRQDGSELYSLFLAMIGQLSIDGGDQTPILCKNEGEGTMFKMSFLMITKVTSVMPKLGLRSQYCPLKRKSRTLKYISGVGASKTCLRTHGIA